jgi:hypothetical protein
LLPITDVLGIPNHEIVAIAVVSSIGLDILPSLVASGPGVEPMAGFFILVFSMSTVIYLANIVPIAVDIFDDVPVRARDLLFMVVIRMAILLPVVAVITHTLNLAGAFS